MNGYRLTFSTQHLGGLVDTVVAADGVLGGAVSALSQDGGVLGFDTFTAGPVAQYVIRFAASTEDAAYEMAREALARARSFPVDSVKLERRSRRYKALGRVIA